MVNQNLRALLPASYQYHISKLYEEYHSGYPMVKADIELLTATLQKLETELKQRDAAYDGIVWKLDDMNHALSGLARWEAAGTLKGNKDAKIFVDALKQYFEDLVVMLDERDQYGGSEE